jgi:two-component system, sensor histidine kinase and response regulator
LNCDGRSWRELKPSSEDSSAQAPIQFTTYTRLSEGSTKAYGGTGSGLDLVRRTIEARGGYVGVGSSPGLGSVFHFTPPVACGG